MTEPPVSDAAVRLLALDPARSILLQAPAGSGKTTVLVLRFLTLLAVVDEPEEILAITFTRKAAAEMRARVQQALHGTLDPASPTFAQWSELRTRVLGHARVRGWVLAELPLRLRIQTIDSLNQYLAAQRPVLDGNSAALQVTERARPLHERAARRTLLDAERDPALRDAMGMIFDRLDNRWNRAEQLIADLLGRRAQWLPRILRTPPDELAARVGESLRSIAADALQRSSECLAEHVGEAHALACASARHRRDAQHPPARWSVWLEPPDALRAEPAHLGYWQALAELTLTAQGTWRKPAGVNVKIGFPPQEKDLKARFTDLLMRLGETSGAQACLVNLLDLPPLQMLSEDAAALAGLARILKLAAAELQLEFDAAGRVDYTMVAASAREALGEADAPSDLAMRFGSGMRHLLVDEFQDTSVEQFALIEALVAGWQQGDGRSLFLVGDPMQSIYQFRAAEVGLFLRAQARGIGAVPLQSLALTRNFRSLPEVTDWVNANFARLLPSQDDLRSSAVRFLAAEPAASGQTGLVRVHALPTLDARQEAAEAVRIVREARARSDNARCAILVASRQHATIIVGALREAGLPVRGIDLEPLATRPAVRDLAALTRALSRPADRIAWLAVLRAPWCGLTLADLTSLCGAEVAAPIPDLLRNLLADPARLASFSAVGSLALSRCAPLLLDASACAGRGELAALVEGTWWRLGGPAACSDAAALEDAESYFVALETLQLETTPDEATLDLLTDALFAQGGSDASDAVEVLTIHRAKGLEWDVVILPGLGRQLRGGDSELLRWIELPRGDDGTDLLMTTLSLGRSGKSKDADPLSRYIGKLQFQRLRNEKVRLAYVAVTRARCELHLLGHAPYNEQRAQPLPRSGSLLALLWPAVETTFLQAEPARDAVLVEGTQPAQLLQRLPGDWRMPELPEDVALEALPLDVQASGALPEYSWVGQTARAIGTVVHAELEAFDRESVPASTASTAARLARHDTALRALGVEARARPAAVQRVEAALARTRTDPRAAWIFARSHTERFAELRLTGLVQGTLLNLVIDRSFIDEQGVRWVIDFKTSTHEGADLQGFLDQEAERYAQPMRQYVALARQLGPQPVRAALYFPLLGAFRELP